MPEIQVKDKLITLEELGTAINAKAGVTSVNNQTGAVSITPTNIGAVATSGNQEINGEFSVNARAKVKMGNTPYHYGFVQFDDIEDSVSEAISLIGFGGDHYLEVRVKKTNGGEEGYVFPAPTIDSGYAVYNVLTSKSPVTILQGGTGATTPAQARANLEITPANIGAVAKSGDTMMGPLTVQGDAIALTDTAKGNLTVYMHISDSEGFGIYSNGYYNGSSFVPSGKWLVYRDTNDVIRLGNAVPVDNGGTNATTPAQARANLEITPANIGALGIFPTTLTFGGSTTNFYQNLGAQINTMSDWESRIFVFTADAIDGPFYEWHTYSGTIMRYNSINSAGILTDSFGTLIAIGCNNGTWSARSL